MSDSGQILIVGLGNPGAQYASTRHNVGFMVLENLRLQWGLSKPKSKWGGMITEGRAGPGGARVVLLAPQNFMNESGKSAGPARGSKKIDLDRVIVVHDEIDLPFGEIKSRLGGGLAGHNGLKSLKANFASPEFWRVRVGVGRPDSTDPERVSGYVLGRFSEPKAEVEDLVENAARETTRLIEKLNAPEAADEAGSGGGEDRP